MQIMKFTHSSKREQNIELFGLIGEFCACEVTRRALSCSISSRPGQVWYVAVEDVAVYAFGSIRLQGKCGLLRHLYSPAHHNEAWEAVLRHCIEHARRWDACSVRLTDYLAMENRYAQVGFIPFGNPRGRFTQYVLRLEPAYAATAMA
jgi:hypothetical protein